MAAFRVQQIVHQFDIHQFPFQRNPGCGKFLIGFLEVVSVFGNGGVAQQGGCLSGRGGTDIPVRGQPKGAVPELQAELPGLAGGGSEGVRSALAHFHRNRRLCRGFGPGDMGDESVQRCELVVVEQFNDVRVVAGVQPHVFGGGIQFDIGLDGYQVVAQPDMRAGFLEQLPLARGQFVQVGVDVLDRAVCADEFGGAYLAHAFYAGHVVGGIAAEGEQFNDLYRCLDAIFGAYFRDTENLFVSSRLAGFVLPDMGIDQLPVILVGRDHIDIEALSLGAFGHGSDDIIGLEPRYHEGGDVEGVAEFGKRLQRVDDQLGRGRAVGLVFGVQLVAESAARGVEGHGYMGGLLAGDEFQQIFCKAIQDGHVLALGIDHRPGEERVIHLEDEGVSVYQKQFHVSKMGKMFHFPKKCFMGSIL